MSMYVVRSLHRYIVLLFIYTSTCQSHLYGLYYPHKRAEARTRSASGNEERATIAGEETPRHPIEIYCSYAPQDRAGFQELEKHLQPLLQKDQISLWHHDRMNGGSKRTQEMETHLMRASLILILTSANYTSATDCMTIELPNIVKRSQEGTRTIPIRLSAVHWPDNPLARLNTLPKTGQPITKRRDQNAAWVEVAAEIERVLATLPQPAAPTTPAGTPRFWNLPYPHNPYFTRREDLLDQFHTRLQSGQAQAITQPQAINGLGGIGKTQLAVEYAYRFNRTSRPCSGCVPRASKPSTPRTSILLNCSRCPNSRSKY